MGLAAGSGFIELLRKYGSSYNVDIKEELIDEKVTPQLLVSQETKEPIKILAEGASSAERTER